MVKTTSFRFLVVLNVGWIAGGIENVSKPLNSFNISFIPVVSDSRNKLIGVNRLLLWSNSIVSFELRGEQCEHGSPPPKLQLPNYSIMRI